MSGFKIGVIVDSFKIGLFDGIKKAKEIGADGIQMYASYGDVSPSQMTTQKRIELKGFMQDNGMVFSALCGELGGHGLSIRAQHKERIELLKRILDMALELDTNIVTTHIGVVPEDPMHERYKVLQEACSTLSEYGESAGGCYAIETGPEKTEVLSRFLKGIDAKAMKVNYDPANLVMVTGEDPVKGVYNLKDYIVHTHAKDGVMINPSDPEYVYACFAEGDIDALNAMDAFQEMPLGEGNVNFASYLNALKDVGYNGFLTIERECGANPAADIKKAVSFLKNTLKTL